MKIQNITAEKLSFETLLLPVILSLILLLAPIFPDVQITRPKLLVIELGVFILMAAWILKTLVSGTLEIRRTSLNIPIVAYIAYISIAYLMSENKSVAVSEFKRMLLCSSIYFLSANILSTNTTERSAHKSQRNIIFTGLITGSTIAMLYGFLQHFGNIKIGTTVFSVPQMGRVASTFGNPIFFAVHLVFFLPILIGLFLYSLQKNKTSTFSLITYHLSFIIIFIIGLLTLFYTQTRAAWIGFFVSTITFGIITIKSPKLKTIFIAVFLFSGLVFSILTWHIWLRHQAHPLIWRDTLAMWLSSPVFGTGIGTFHINFPKFASQQLLAVWPQTQRIINDAHNEYVQLLAETGIAGFGIFIWIIYSFFRSGFVLNEKTRDTKEAFLITGLLCSAIAVLIQNFFSVDMRFIISAFYLFLVMGILTSFENKSYLKKIKINKTIKVIAVTAVLLISGIIGINMPPAKPAIHIASLFHYGFTTHKLEIKPLPEGTGLLPEILRPYLAQKTLSEQTDFFDERVLQPLKTIDELENLQKKYPNETKIYEKLAWVYSKEKNFPKAIECYQNALRINPNLSGVLNNLGNVYYYYMKNLDKSIECYKKSIEVDTNQLDAHLNLGILLYLEGRLKESAEHFDFVLKKDPTNEKAIVYLKRMRE